MTDFQDHNIYEWINADCDLPAVHLQNEEGSTASVRTVDKCEIPENDEKSSDYGQDG